MTIEALASLPLSAELLEYYQQRARTQETELANFVEKLNEITPKYEKIHSLEWELFTRTKELEILKNKLSDSNIALFEERKHLLKVVAENDALKVQELKDKKKIRYLLSCTQEIPLENETTYIKDSLSKKIVRIQNEQKSRQQSKDQPKPKFAKHDSNVVILEDEIEALKLTLLATQTQLEEQKATYEDTIQNFEKDRYQKVQESKIRSEYDDAKIKSLHEQVDKLRAMCRENTRELLQSKKDFKVRERQLHEAKTYLNQQVKHLAGEVETQTERNENIERVVEEKVVKKQESLVSDLRHVLGRTEEDLRIAKANYEQMEHTYKKKQEFLKQRADSITQSYNSLKKRRDHEIEGFTNDIIHLRKSLKKLEKYILKFGPLEDKELVLLDIARETGLKIEKISSSLSGLKNRIYLAENELRNLAF